MSSQPALPRIVNGQRMGGRLHVCVEDLTNARGNDAGQKCACGQIVVQSDEIRLGADKDGNPVDWREHGLEERDFCKPCWKAYLPLRTLWRD